MVEHTYSLLVIQAPNSKIQTIERKREGKFYPLCDYTRTLFDFRIKRLSINGVMCNVYECHRYGAYSLHKLSSHHSLLVIFFTAFLLQPLISLYYFLIAPKLHFLNRMYTVHNQNPKNPKAEQ